MFSYDKVNENFVSPLGLIDKIQNEFFDQKSQRIIRDSSQIIRNELGDDAAHEITERLCENNPNSLNEEFAKIATYSIVQKTLPVLLENKYLKENFESCKAIISNDPGKSPVPSQTNIQQHSSGRAV